MEPQDPPPLHPSTTTVNGSPPREALPLLDSFNTNGSNSHNINNIPMYQFPIASSAVSTPIPYIPPPMNFALIDPADLDPSGVLHC